MLALIGGLVIMLCCIRFFMILPKRIREGRLDLHKTTSSNTNSTNNTIRTLVVLGSGGHTGEIMGMVQTLDPKRYKFEFVLAQTDKDSEKFVRNILKDKEEFHPLSFHFIPRSREVHQSYFTSIFTTLRALLYTTLIT